MANFDLSSNMNSESPVKRAITGASFQAAGYVDYQAPKRMNSLISPMADNEGNDDDAEAKNSFKMSSVPAPVQHRVVFDGASSGLGLGTTPGRSNTGIELPAIGRR